MTLKREKIWRNCMAKNFQSLIRFIRLARQDEPQFLFWLVFSAVIKGIAPLVNIILPKFILDELLGGKDLVRMFILTAVLALGNLLFSFLKAVASKQFSLQFYRLYNHLYGHLAKKTVHLDMAVAEKKSSLDKIEHAKYAFRETDNMDETMAEAGGAIISLISMTILIITYDWRLLPIVLIFNLLTIPCFRKVSALELDNSRRNVPENRAFGYFCNIAGDFRFAKDMRLYQGSSFLMKKAKETMDKIIRINHEFYTKSGIVNGLAAMIIQIQLAIIFLFLGISLAAKNISVGTFYLLAGACRQFGEAINSIILGFTNLMTISLEFDPYFEYLDLSEKEETPEHTHEPDSGKNENEPGQTDKGMVLEFDDVGFYYPSSDNPVLDNINLSVKTGDKVAIVGLNGAGKTTLIKLLCRLYTPQRGKILLNGKDIRTIPKDQYYQSLAVVFQDFRLIPVSIAENVGCKNIHDLRDHDLESIKRRLQEAGIADWVDSLPRGVHTELTKLYAEDGAMPSGGQEQKLAIARSLYQNASLLVLDEPTAALDPRSEEAVYDQFNKMTEGKTAIFISHRLSSTRMADYIIVMDKGRIVEQGSHEMLMQAKGLYAEMYGKQANQYVEESLESLPDCV